jgi:hypothetical protein
LEKLRKNWIQDDPEVPIIDLLPGIVSAIINTPSKRDLLTSSIVSKALAIGKVKIQPKTEMSIPSNHDAIYYNI